MAKKFGQTKFLGVSLNVFFVVVLLAIGFILGIQYKSLLDTSSESQNKTKVEADGTWKTYIRNKPENLSFSGFTLHYPSSWNLEADDSQGMLFLKLVKGDAELKIVQAAFGGGLCVYGNEPNPQVPFGRYTDFVDLTGANSGLMWRRSLQAESPSYTYSICQGSADGSSYGTVTSAGAITYTLKSKENDVLSEMDQIVKRIEVMK